MLHAMLYFTHDLVEGDSCLRHARRGYRRESNGERRRVGVYDLNTRKRWRKLFTRLSSSLEGSAQMSRNMDRDNRVVAANKPTVGLLEDGRGRSRRRRGHTAL